MKFVFMFLFFTSSTFAYETYSEGDFKSSSTETHFVKILNHGLGSLEERLQLIENAAVSIDVEYYIFKQDFASQIFTQALIKKAREGIKVRILIDFFANKKSPNPHVLAMIHQEGVEVKFFNTSPMINLYNVQFRNHRKALIIDNEVAVIGGRNIANEYFDLSEYYNFLDRDMTISGSIVKTISTSFEANFNSRWASYIKFPKKPERNDHSYRNDNDYPASSHKYYRDLKRWKENQLNAIDFLSKEIDVSALRHLGSIQLAQAHSGTCNNLQFISEVPSFGRKRKYARLLKDLIRKKIEEAQTSIIMESPYFIMTDEFKKVVDKTLDSKVNIKLLTNSINSTDHVFTYSAFESQLYGMLHQHLDTFIANGKRPDHYEVLPEQEFAKYGIHSKTYVFDDKDFIISTFNFDPRSSDINSELLILCEDSPELAEVIKEDIQLRMQETYHIDTPGDLFDATYKKGKIKKIIFFLLSKLPSRLLRSLL